MRNGSQFFLDRYNDFFTKQFIPYLIDNNIDTLLIGGDTWESRKNININSMYHAKRMFFEPLYKNNIKVYSILGNHDVVYKNTNKVHSIEFLEDSYSNFKTIYDHDVINFDGVKIGMVSWLNKENYEEQLSFIKDCDCDYLLGHFEIDGFEMTKGHVHEGGLSQKIFNRFDGVWSGHFHIKSKIGNITYLGNPFQTNRGDVGYDRGFHIFDTQTKDLTFIKNDYNIYEAIHYNDDMDLINFNYDYYNNKIVIVNVFSLLESNTDSLNLLVSNLNNVAYRVEVNETKTITKSHNLDDTEVKSHTQIISDYIDGVIDDDTQAKNIKKIMIERYNECLNEE